MTSAIRAHADLSSLLDAEAPPRDDSLPFVAINMVASVDGKATLGGRVGAMTSPDDQEALHLLRAQADAVLVGASTVRREGYGRLLPDPLREARAAEGRPAEPLLAVVSASLRMDPQTAALRPGGPRPLLVLTSADGTLEADGVDYLRAGEAADHFLLGPMLARLKAEHGVERVVCEGGPTLNGALFAESLVDAVFLTVSPLIAGGGESLTIVAGRSLPAPLPLHLVSVGEAGGHVLLRYAVAR